MGRCGQMTNILNVVLKIVVGWFYSMSSWLYDLSVDCPPAWSVTRLRWPVCIRPSSFGARGRWACCGPSARSALPWSRCHSHPAVVGGHTRAALPRGSGFLRPGRWPLWGLHGDGLARPRMPWVSSHPDPTPCLPVSRCAGLHVSHHGVGQRGLPVSVQILQHSNRL